MKKRITVLILSVFLFAFSAYASNVWVIDSTYDNHGYIVQRIIENQAPDANVHFECISHSPQINAWDAANAIRKAVDSGADIINLSFGSQYRSQALENAIAYAASRNVVVTVASGNDGGATPNFPAYYSRYYSNVISVGALEANPFTGQLERASYSNSAQVFAPGEAYGVHGTSFASPYVAGQIANAMDNRNISAVEAKAAIVDNHNAVGPATVHTQRPYEPESPLPEQILPDKDIWYDLLAAIIFREMVKSFMGMDSFFSDVFAAANPFSDFQPINSGFSGNYERNSNFFPSIPYPEYSGGVKFAPILDTSTQDFSPWGL